MARHGERGAAAVRGIQRAGTDVLGGGATAATTHQGGQTARPVTNVKVAGWEVDVFWPAERLVVEVDG